MANNSKETSSSNTKPVSRIKVRGITASIFANETKNGSPFHKVSLTRTFKDGDEFKSTTTFSRDDLPLIEEVARQAWREIMRLESIAAIEKTS